MLLRSLVIVALACLAPTVAAQVSFTTGQTIPIAIRPGGAAVGDFNGDGQPDLAVSADTIDRVDIFLGDGSGTFGAPTPVLTGPNSGPDSLVADDFDGDGDLDLAVVLKNVSSVILLVNNGTGAFTLTPGTATGFEPSFLVEGDLDGDGDTDLATANRDSNNVTVLLNNGTGSFTASSFAVGLEPRAVGIGDFDGDGDLDLASTDHDARSITVLQNSGAGTFTTAATLAMGLFLKPDGIDVADTNGDGNLDLVVAASDNGLNFVSVFPNNGTAFGASINTATVALDPSDVVVEDFDFDGTLDLAVTGNDGNQLEVMTGTGDHTFISTAVFPTGLGPDALVRGDLDGDGKVDLVVPNSDGDSVSLFLNTSTGVPPTGETFIRGNLNGDGAVDISDAVFGLASLFVPGSAAPGCLDAADTNDDGNFDVADAVALLNALFLLGSPPLPLPNVECGLDPTPDTLGCVNDTGCP